jgi:hypothetical protein
VLCPHLCPRKNRFPSSLVKETLALRTHFGNGKNQMRRGTAKQENADCSGATSRVKPEKITVSGWTFVQRSLGKSLRIPANTKNIPVSKSTEIKWDSMSPVATGKLSRLSSCMNGENTAISTISRSTILGILRCIRLRRGAHGKVIVAQLRLTAVTIAPS